MNGYLIAFFLLVIAAAIVLVIIRDAISVDGAKAKAALQNFGARIQALFRKGP